ncbi:orotidine 5-phosphate decarboxylase [Marinitoga sp. 1135]|uniref:Orotidine-5'-phosphate decarboxylase n=1 Tax=Marinitoga piezophila (strain DSM 14283 / JCM 11233 / KA3) TaxID=443254 RepID=H2J4G2_MARPK|nr:MULTISPECIES: orotidine-5'-phosphate decarboxylase [Marinitoga]AEX84817.1 orotidine 5''-phosphate decarboxylase, subfamily 2 [Marinitoga piezophila KA3]APT75327.1 orotidine 5-phosphate decarboxylase [Marinitoga sp. 1137]NUU95059.1 orotidine 5-phosphate decarboxylase [Marinitoga sp. 1135]NUU97013.1 orotidine 5-phosphate decarboxylase [Marinitoga sp. 1138]
MLEKYLKRRESKKSVLFAGLDSDFEKIDGDVLDFNKKIIDETSDIVCGYKLNIAFYEKMGHKGIEILEKTIEYIKQDESIPIILDAKRSDIGNTAAAYAYYYFNVLKVDSLTVNPLMGFDTMLPYLEYQNAHLFALALTTNKGAYDFEIPEKLYLKITKMMNEKNKEYKNKIGIVVGATNSEFIDEIVENSEDMLFLIPGIGAQQGNVEKLFRNLKGYKNIVINVSRGIIFNENPREKAKEYNELISKYYNF